LLPVAVISNGTAILGLGNRGALASKPVMEGKAVLFKRFADVDAIDIEVNTQDPDEFIRVVAAIAQTFGGINLEDIKAPECFYIEEHLVDMLDIPVFHDDQHGTAIIVAAALLNGLELVGKQADEIKDSRGVIYKGRQERMNPYKELFAVETDARTLAEAMVGADVFIGLSIANIVSPEMVKSMAERPLIFALANPDPEIPYEVAKEARPDAIIATGRSDYPNQVNNVLGFPFIFRGALDVRARKINDEMKLAAARALADLAKQDVPDSVLRAYGLERLQFGPEYIIPKPFDPRVLLWEAPAVAQAAMETGVARRHIDIEAYREELALRQGKGEHIRHFFIHNAKAVRPRKRVVFAEGEEIKILRAAAQVKEEGIAEPILLGRREIIEVQPEIVDPKHFPKQKEYARALYQLRQRKGVTFQRACKLLQDPNVLAPMMVKMGDADAAVSGIVHEYPEVIRPALQIHGTAPGYRLASGTYIVIVDGKVYLFADATVNIEPTAEDLADIAIATADFAKRLGLEPRVALLSGKAEVIGPILLGMGAPVHVLQTGDEVRDIVYMVAVAVMDAVYREREA